VQATLDDDAAPVVRPRSTCTDSTTAAAAAAKYVLRESVSPTNRPSILAAAAANAVASMRYRRTYLFCITDEPFRRFAPERLVLF